MPTAATPAGASSRVVKKRDPQQAGARRRAAQYDEALVCVRYRIDPVSQQRQNTVEIVVDSAPTLASLQVGLRIPRAEIELPDRQGRGGRWDPQAGVWQVPLGAARRLGLSSRIVCHGVTS